MVGAVVRMGPRDHTPMLKLLLWKFQRCTWFEVSLDGYHLTLLRLTWTGAVNRHRAGDRELLNCRQAGELYDSLSQPLGVQGSTDCPMTFLRSRTTQLLGANAEIGRLELSNSQWYPCPYHKTGPRPSEFHFLTPGHRDFQLRVWDNRGWARSLPPYAVELTWDVLAFHAVLSCDAPASLELHVFQRAPGGASLTTTTRISISIG